MKKGYLYIMFSTVLFSTMEIMLKMTSGGFRPLQITFLRFLIGALVLLPFAIRSLKKRNYRFQPDDLLYGALTGFCCVLVSMVLYQMAIVYSDASIVAILFSCNPVFVMLLASLLLREKIYKHSVISILISLSGIAVIVNALRASGSLTGTVLSILAAVTFALYSVLGKKRSDRYGSVAITCFSFAFGVIEMLIFILLTRTAGFAAFLTQLGLETFAYTPILAGLTMDLLPSLLYIGIGVTGFGYAFYFMAMEKTSATTASLVFFIKPALAPILAFLILHEPLTPAKITGIVLILIGSLINFIFHWNKQKEHANQLKTS